MNKVILIDDEEHLRTACSQALELADIEVECFNNSNGALDCVTPVWPGVIVTDIRMPGASGLDVLNQAMELDPELPVILITGHGDIQMAVKAIRDGAYDFIEKPFASEILVDTVRRALEKRRLALENLALRTALEKGKGLENRLVGHSSEINRLRQEVENFAATDADVLIHGETGVGKELVARSLHDYSPRKNGRFVAINCGALPENMIESELFGHEAGAFTGALKKRIGRIEYANGGTLFLDELESMPMDLQIKLLRVLQDRVVVPLGSNDDVKIDVRIVAATKENLRERASAGYFREDLYYRLEVLSLFVPPLRQRGDDIPLLFKHFVDLACVRYNKPPISLTPAKISELRAHNWPGNVRELQNAALRFTLVNTDVVAPVDFDETQGLAEQMNTHEQNLIQTALAKNDNSLKATYEALKISRKTLYDKMQKHRIASETSERIE
ncbi:Fis family transcriptional regulator [Alphaproteobacteria bacterium 46_93_T64]|nr:Fis family transcriptional regulator [Alphaproteobacteria bacterium 46_93_T64]